MTQEEILEEIFWGSGQRRLSEFKEWMQERYIVHDRTAYEARKQARRKATKKPVYRFKDPHPEHIMD